MSERSDRRSALCRKAHRNIRPERRRYRLRIVLGALGIAALGATIVFPPAPRLVWNASESAPRGLYLVRPGAPVEPGDMVVARTPTPWRALAAVRRYLPANVPLVKRVVAARGDIVCARGDEIAVNGAPVAARRTHDARGRSLPWWKGCRRLNAGEAFLLMAHEDDSFDGRYFGPTGPYDIVGKARLLWAR